MSKIVSFKVTLEFSDDITKEEEIVTIASNIALALESEINHGEGLSPNDEAFTVSITVKADLLEDELKINLFTD